MWRVPSGSGGERGGRIDGTRLWVAPTVRVLVTVRALVGWCAVFFLLAPAALR